MSEKVKTAEDLFLQGYNCSQSVFAAFSKEVNLDRKTALMLSSPFGAGMGRLREVCGAVSAMFMIAGLKYGYSEPLDGVKAEHYKFIQELAHIFKEQNGSIICRELLGLENPEGSPVPEKRTEDYYNNRPCLELVKRAAEIIEKFLEEKEV
jgi:C_GCAxxG_C_C family probable redox protein